MNSITSLNDDGPVAQGFPLGRDSGPRRVEYVDKADPCLFGWYDTFPASRTEFALRSAPFIPFAAQFDGETPLAPDRYLKFCSIAVTSRGAPS
ncbi:hypothetical protein [Streptomyces sp. NPDC085665]|uniref:hypothetical protein n=1 Tax=Streptomyces sp. NPDC085665 TaxID=3365735 RepID=UPI0037D1A62D